MGSGSIYLRNFLRHVWCRCSLVCCRCHLGNMFVRRVFPTFGTCTHSTYTCDATQSGHQVAPCVPKSLSRVHKVLFTPDSQACISLMVFALHAVGTFSFTTTGFIVCATIFGKVLCILCEWGSIVNVLAQRVSGCTALRFLDFRVDSASISLYLLTHQL